MFIVHIWQDVLEQAGVLGVLILAIYVSIGVGGVLWLAGSIARAALRGFRRWWHRRQLRRELRILRGGRPAPLFSFYPELEDLAPRPPVRSLRRRGDDDAAA